MSMNLLQFLMVAPVPMGIALTVLIACKLRRQAITPPARFL